MQEPYKYEVKSRPVYPPVSVNPLSSFHVFVAEHNGLSMLEPLFEACANGRKLMLVVSAEAPNNSLYQRVEASNISNLLKEVLTGAPVTSTVYVAGSESFLWDTRKAARDAGLSGEQVLLCEPVVKHRRLFCTHCHGITEAVTHSPCSCSHCGRILLVRDHFSRLHGAYVGVQINAEDPADIPATEELKS